MPNPLIHREKYIIACNCMCQNTIYSVCNAISFSYSDQHVREKEVGTQVIVQIKKKKRQKQDR